MAANKSILILAGDGIGPEVMVQVRRVIDWFDKRREITFEVTEDLVGGAAYDAHGTPLTDETLADAMACDAVLFGAVGGPKYDDAPRALRPEMGLLRLRKELDLFANLRPAIAFESLLDASSLKPDVIRGLDMLIVRESTSGVYFGEPRGIETMPDGSRQAVDTQFYTDAEIIRVAGVAFDLARQRRGKVTSAEKANVMETGVLWREEVTKLHAKSYADVELEHMYADNCAMQLVRAPTQFDVILADNLFGDILSDCAAMLTGSLGMLPSATLGAPDDSGRRRALYEPVHGSAPDIAGTGAANPLACLLSFAMLLRFSFDLEEDATLIENSVANVLNSGVRTADIMDAKSTRVSTGAMGDAILRELDKQAA
jgi:3-isopropylmalate dehydrogenase